MDIEKIIYLGYEIELIYQPFYDDSTPKSKQYTFSRSYLTLRTF